MSNHQHASLTSVETYIQPLLSRVLSADTIGACYETIKVESISSSCNQTKGDRLELSIPYAGGSLIWNIHFDLQRPEVGPDFIFHDCNFLADVDADTLSTKVPSLAKWDPSDKNALVNVLNELLLCYKQQQIQLLKKHDRLQRQYTALMESCLIQPKDVDIYFSTTSEEKSARFLIRLSLNTLPLGVEEDLEAIFLISFSGPDLNHIAPYVVPSKALVKVLEHVGPLRLEFPPDEWVIHMVEVKRCIEDKLNLVDSNRASRKSYIRCALSCDYASCLEFDSVDYTYIANLFKEGDFHFVVRVQLPLGFPREAPVAHLLSIYHMASEYVPYSKQLGKYPYNEGGEYLMMYTNLRYFIKEYIKEFKSNSIKMSS